MVAAASPSPPRFIIEAGRNPWNRLTEMGLNSSDVFSQTITNGELERCGRSSIEKERCPFSGGLVQGEGGVDGDS